METWSIRAQPQATRFSRDYQLPNPQNNYHPIPINHPYLKIPIFPVMVNNLVLTIEPRMSRGNETEGGKNGDDSTKPEHRVRGRMRFFERFEPDTRSSNWNANDNEWGGSLVGLENLKLVRTFAKSVPDRRTDGPQFLSADPPRELSRRCTTGFVKVSACFPFFRPSSRDYCLEVVNPFQGSRSKFLWFD